MSALRTFDYRIWITLGLSWLVAELFNKLTPMFLAKPLYLLAFPIGILFFAILVIRPKEVLVGLLLLRPIMDNFLNTTKTDVGGGQGIGLGAILNLLIVALGVFLCFRLSAFPQRNRVVWCWIFFLGMMFLATLYSPYKFGAVRLYFNYLSYFALLIIPFILIKTKADFLFWLKVLAGSFILPVLFANIDMLRGGHYFADAGQRISGTFTHPNILAFYLVLGITIYSYLLKSSFWRLNGLTKFCMLAFILNMLVLLIATKTRNAWIACAVGFFVYGLLKDRKFLLIMLCAMPLTLTVPTIKERVLTVISPKKVINYDGINSMEWRFRMWKSSLPLIAKRPIQGYGLTSFKPMSDKFSDIGRNKGAHNTYLEVLFEMGIFGLLGFMSLFLSALYVFFKYMQQSINLKEAKLWAIIIGYVTGYLVVCLADNMLYYLVLNWYVWFFIALMLLSKRFIHD